MRDSVPTSRVRSMLHGHVLKWALGDDGFMVDRPGIAVRVDRPGSVVTGSSHIELVITHICTPLLLWPSTKDAKLAHLV